MEPIVGIVSSISQMFTTYTLVLILLAPFTYKYVDLLLLCCINACAYFVIAYILPGYIQAGDLVITNIYAKILIDVSVHWFPLIVVYLLYGSYYKTNIHPRVYAFMLYAIYLIVVDYKQIYHHNTSWMLLLGGFTGVLLEFAILR